MSHESGNPEDQSLLAKTPASVMSAQISLGGLYGHRTNVTVEPQFARTPSRGPTAPCSVVFVLRRPDYPSTDRQYSVPPSQRGDSLIALSAPASGRPQINSLQISIPEQPQISLTAYPNEGGSLGRIEAQIEARSLSEAAEIAYGAASSLLSVWSTQLDTPLEIWQMGGTDEVSKVVFTSFVVPFPDKPFLVPAQPKTSPEFRACAGFYREALNSNSPPYQFLCLFKVLEAIRHRRATVRTAPGRVPQDLLRMSELIPNSDAECEEWLKRIYYVRPAWHPFEFRSLFPAEIRGQKLGRIFTDHLYPLRVAIAHALVEGGEVKVSLDVLRQLRTVEKWVPLTKVMARRMLKNEFSDEFLVGLGEDGQPHSARASVPA